MMVSLLVSTNLPSSWMGKIHSANSQSAGAPSFIELGYGPTTLSPLQDGTPVYTTGDNLWVSSNYDQALSISLLRPDNSVASGQDLTPTSVVQLYTFGPSDQPGNWTVEVTFGNATSTFVNIVLAIPAQTRASLSQYSIQQGDLNLGFSVQQSSAYNIEACLLSARANSTTYVSIPSGLGGGSLGIQSNSSTASVYESSNSRQHFTFWYELEYYYSYSGSLPNETISRSLAVAKSPTFLFPTNSTQTGPLQVDASLRPGRYVLTAFFDSSGGLAVAETRMLLQNNGSWLWLGGCTPFAVSSSTFTSQISLSQIPSAWPRVLYFMYDSQGIEAVSTTSLRINVARVDAATEPKNITLPNLTYSISENPRVIGTGTFGGSLFVIAKSFPVSLIVTPSLGSMTLNPQNLTIPGPLTETRLFIPVGTLQVHVSNDSKPLAGATVLVANLAGGELSSSTDSHGNDTVYLPAGRYNVTVLTGSGNSSQSALISVGKVSSAYFSFSTPPSFTTAYLLTALAVMAVVGLALNAWVWRTRRNRPKSA
jgi:hypothetical protein